MPQVINTNVASLNSQRSLNMSQTSLATSLQRLSSGLRINSAKDDAAGLAISDRMNSQIRGLNQATRNANDGISLAQTAEGDLEQISNNLQRMRELAVQAGNATNSASDRQALNAEVQSLASEIDRVAQNSSFNGTKLLDGSFVAQNFQIGANGTANDRLAITAIGSARTSALGGTGTSFAATTTGTATTTALAAGDLTLNGFQVGASSLGTGPGQSAASAFSIAAAINGISSNSGVTATAEQQQRSWISNSDSLFTAIAAEHIQHQWHQRRRVAAAQAQRARVPTSPPQSMPSGRKPELPHRRTQRTGADTDGSRRTRYQHWPEGHSSLCRSPRTLPERALFSTQTGLLRR
jgi:flagellin-like hook-associated protein FlgL